MVSGAQLNEIAIKGRDFVSFLSTLPGVVDTNLAGRDSIGRNALNGVSINGTRSQQTILMHDGVPSVDSGNSGAPDEPNMDSIAEVKVLSNHYAAEFGRNAGGLVTVVTKSGSSEFHGSAYYHFRDDSLNANTFFNNRTNTPKQPSRHELPGYSIGGPVFLPGIFNTNKDKLFFFFSQEIVKSEIAFPTSLANTPTELERQGDFSRSFDVNGNLIAITDPLTGEPFPGNVIPKERIDPLGQAILNFYPLPNFTDPDPENRYRWNHRATYSGDRPRHQEVTRIDANFWPSFRAYYRLSNYVDEQATPFGSVGWPAGDFNYVVTPIIWSRPARSHAFHATKIFSPTLIAEFTFGKTFNDVQTLPEDPSRLDRAAMSNPAQWYEDPGRPDQWLPAISFGNVPVNPLTRVPVTSCRSSASTTCTWSPPT